MKLAFPPREFQKEAIEKWEAAVAAGRKRGLIVAPTGAGKAITALMVAARAGRSLWLTHREELIDQLKEEARSLFVEPFEIGVIKAERNEYGAKDLVVASIQTLSRENRLNDFVRAQVGLPPLKHVIVDEAHHYASPKWMRVLDTEPMVSTPTCGFTATDERSDDLGLAKVWGAKPVYKLTRDEAIDKGILVPWKKARIYCDKLHLEGIPIVDGDYEPTELEKEMVRANVARAIAEAARDIVTAENRKTIIFSVSVNQAQRIAAILREFGIAADCVWGDMDKMSRKATIERFKRGELRVLTNCGLLIEGFNDTSVSCVIVGRPTRSRPFFFQAIGRAFRLHPSKEDCLIVDLVGATVAHDQVTTDALDEDEAEDAKPKKKQVQETQLFGQKDGEFGLIKGFIRAATYGVEGAPKRRRARVRWLEVTPDVFALSAGEHGSLLMVREGGAETWRGYRLPKDAWDRDEAIPIMRQPTAQELACGVIEDRARKLGVFGLVNEAARWREAPPSDEQAKMFARLYPNEALPGTRGEASDAISTAKLRKFFVAASR